MISKRSGAKGATEVRKRDNRMVPFDRSKIADAIYRALRSVDQGDRTLAEELASAVTHFLDERFSGAIPGIEDIQDLVETVLIEMGHAKVAKSYILYRQKRAMLRETLEVRRVPVEADVVEGDELPEVLPRGTSGDRVPTVDQDEGGISRWSKSKVAAALIRKADLDPTVAAEVASAVERKVLESGISRISSSLIRELVDNELFERGFSAKLEKQAPIGLSPYDLEQVIFGGDVKEGYAFPKTPEEVRKIVANRILHQYSLKEVLTPPVADAHRDGRVFVHRLSDPVRLSTLHWALPLPGNSASARPQASRGKGRQKGDALGDNDRLVATDMDAAHGYLDEGDFFRRLAHLARFFSEEIHLKNLPRLLQDASSREPSPREHIRRLLQRLAQMGSSPQIVLEFDLDGECLPWLEELNELSLLHPRRLRVSLRLRTDGQDRPSAGVLEQVAALYGRGEIVEFLPATLLQEAAAGERRGSAGLDAEVGLASDVAKITINLPRVAFRSARDQRTSIEAELDAIVELVIKGHLERRRFIERLGANRENPLWGVLGEVTPSADAGAGVSTTGPLALAEGVFVVGILGLNECVKFLTGKELHQSEVAQDMADGIVRRLAGKLRQDSKRLGIRLVLEEALNVGPLRTLERADLSRFPQMAEIDRGRQPQWGPRYSDGVRFHRMAPLDPLRRVEELSPYVRLLRPAGGIVEDFPELRRSARELLPSLLEETLLVLQSAVYPDPEKPKPSSALSGESQGWVEGLYDN